MRDWRTILEWLRGQAYSDQEAQPEAAAWARIWAKRIMNLYNQCEKEEAEEQKQLELLFPSMKRRGRHAASLATSERLQRTLKVLEDRKAHGATTLQIQAETGSMAPATDISELRANGIEIPRAKDIGRTEGGRRIFWYVLKKYQARPVGE